MQYTTLGSTGMTVSRLCLGCMSFGIGGLNLRRHQWTLEEDESRELIERAIDLGINFFDSANIYTAGQSEAVLGRVLADYDRDAHVVATKLRFDPLMYVADRESHPNASGLSRKTVEQELENSLDRLEMDTVDLYQIHRWDYDTPIEETLRALDDAVRRNQVRYIGASSMWTYQFATALRASERGGLERFATMQNHYNLVYREEEREMLPYCEREGVGVIPWSPLGQGYLTRPHNEIDATHRGDELSGRHEEYRSGGGPRINERVEELAEDHGVTMAQLSLAWVLHQDAVDAPIVGTTSIEHLEEAVEALEIDLTESDQDYLEEPYEPLEVASHQ